MAEFIGLAASLITLACAGAKLADTLRNAVNMLSLKDSEASLIAADISAFSSYLTQWGKVSGLSTVPEAGSFEEIALVLRPACGALVAKLQKLIGELLPSTKMHPLLLIYLRCRFKWILNGPEVVFLRGMMDSFKSTLTLLVSTMDLTLAVRRNEPEPIKESLKAQVKTSIGFVEDAQESLLRFEDELSNQISSPSSTILQDPRSTVVDILTIESAVDDSALSQLVFPHNSTEMPTLDDSALHGFGVDHQAVNLKNCSPALLGILKAQEMTLALATDLLSPPPPSNWTWGLQHLSPEPQDTKESRMTDTKESIAATNMLHSASSSTQNQTRSQPQNAPERSDGESSQNGEKVSIWPGPHDLDAQKIQRPTSSSDIEAIVKRLLDEALSAQKRHGYPMEDDHGDFAQVDDDILPRSARKYTGRSDRSRTTDERFSKLEALLIEQTKIREAKELEKKRAADEAAKAAADAKRMADEDKLSKLEALIIAHKDEQLRRENDAEARAAVVKADQDARAAKESAEKYAAANAAANLLAAAKRAREEAEAKAVKDSEEAKSAHRKALAEAKAAAHELEKAKLAAEEEAAKLVLSDTSPIKFKDALGRKFSFPWQSCNTWAGMETLIKEAFVDVDDVSFEVERGHYDLISSDGESILPLLWDATVKPDASITMHMWSSDGMGPRARKIMEQHGTKNNVLRPKGVRGRVSKLLGKRLSVSGDGSERYTDIRSVSSLPS